MAKRPAGDWGRSPETPGHERLVKFVAKHSIAHVAALVGVKPAVAHAWYWRDARPSDEMVKRLVDDIGGTREEWLTDDERKRSREAARARKKRVKELQKGAA